MVSSRKIDVTINAVGMKIDRDMTMSKIHDNPPDYKSYVARWICESPFTQLNINWDLLPHTYLCPLDCTCLMVGLYLDSKFKYMSMLPTIIKWLDDMIRQEFLET